ncbi:hypothetical protein PQR34_47960 [Paraburkholderia sediminicola]|uniref:hypothetical protein n=1 Tax=Paraburkholderia sediminicola TaxID=458836 RepID=UPI0038B7D847
MVHPTKVSTPYDILNCMSPGNFYSAYRIARSCVVSIGSIRDVLSEMVEYGLLEKVLPPGTKTYKYRVIASCESRRLSRPPLIGRPSVALPRTHTAPPGVLCGYDAAFACRKALCMLVRPR